MSRPEAEPRTSEGPVILTSKKTAGPSLAPFSGQRSPQASNEIPAHDFIGDVLPAEASDGQH